MRYLYLAWLHGGHDPYRLFNRLDDDYRPLEASAGDDRPQHRPPDPKRVAHVVYGFAALAVQESVATARMASGGAV